MTKSKTLEQYYLDERIAINNANKNVFLAWHQIYYNRTFHL